MWDLKTGRSKGYGFVSFRDQQVLLILLNWKSGMCKKSRRKGGGVGGEHLILLGLLSVLSRFGWLVYVAIYE